MLNTKNPLLNVIITCSKFISSPFICSFSTTIPIISPFLAPLSRDDCCINHWNNHMRHMSLSWQDCAFLKSTGKHVGFFAILQDKLLNRESKMSGTVRVTGDGLTWLNYAWVCNNLFSCKEILVAKGNIWPWGTGEQRNSLQDKLLPDRAKCQRTYTFQEFLTDDILLFFQQYFSHMELKRGCSSHVPLCNSLYHMSRLVSKPTKWPLRPAKTQTSLGICPVWSESSLSAWRNIGCSATHWVHCKDWSDWGDAQADLSLCWAHRSFVGFVMRRLNYDYVRIKTGKKIIILKLIAMQCTWW